MFQVRDSQGVLRPFSFRSYDKYPVGKGEQDLRHIWYSKQMAEKLDSIARYRLCDYEIVVDVTAASETTYHGCLWDDLVYLGVGWYVGSKDNDRSLNRGFDSSYTSLHKPKYEEVNTPANDLQWFNRIIAELARVEESGNPPTAIIIDSYSQLPATSIIDSYRQRQAFDLAAHGNSYRQVRQSMGDYGGHSGVDAPDAVEPDGHPDNPTFTVRYGEVPGVSAGPNRGGDAFPTLTNLRVQP